VKTTLATKASRAICRARWYSDLGLTPEVRDDHAAYIASWLQVLKNDKRAIFSAAAHAQKAVDYLHGLQATAEGRAARAAGHQVRIAARYSPYVRGGFRPFNCRVSSGSSFV